MRPSERPPFNSTCAAAGQSKCVLCFDFDGTIRLFNGDHSHAIYGIMDDVQRNGIWYGITTANCGVDQVKG